MQSFKSRVFLQKDLRGKDRLILFDFFSIVFSFISLLKNCTDKKISNILKNSKKMFFWPVIFFCPTKFCAFFQTEKVLAPGCASWPRTVPESSLMLNIKKHKTLAKYCWFVKFIFTEPVYFNRLVLKNRLHLRWYGWK